MFFILSATQGLVALAGLRTLGFDSVAPLGLAQPLSLLPRAVGDVLHLASFQLAAIKPFFQERLGMYSRLASLQLVDKGAKPL